MACFHICNTEEVMREPAVQLSCRARGPPRMRLLYTPHTVRSSVWYASKVVSKNWHRLCFQDFSCLGETILTASLPLSGVHARYVKYALKRNLLVSGGDGNGFQENDISEVLEIYY